MDSMINSSSLPEKDKTPLVIQLLEIIRQQAEEIQQRLKDEIARLKGHSSRPQIRPGRLEQPKDDEVVTYTVGLATFTNQYEGVDMMLVSAASFVALLPAIVMFAMFHKHFVIGLTGGALKG